MHPIAIILICVLAAALLVLATSYICFYLVFFVPKKDHEAARADKYPIPDGAAYEPYRENMIDIIKRADELVFREYSITSRDGLTLRARYYEYKEGAPIELMLHGYRGSGRRDLSAGIFRAASVGRSAFVIDHRGAGESEGNVITFGVKEKEDCLDWLDFIIKEFGDGVRVVLTGISMGAATVMLAAGEDLPRNVVGVLADCGYTSAKEIIKKVITEMRLPATLLYPFVRLGGMIFGGFDVNLADARAALGRSRVPIIFYHGDTDDFVPREMTEENYKACRSRKKLVIIPFAGHGLCYMKDPEYYISTLRDFFKPEFGEH